MNTMEEEIKTDQELYSYFRDRNTTLCRENFSFLMLHPEVKRLLNDYLSNLLLHKPEDVFMFTKEFFKPLSSSAHSPPLVVLVGPDAVGKKKILEFLKNFFFGFFEEPRMCVVGEKEGYERLTPEEYTNGIRKDEFLFFYSEKKEYFGLRKQEIFDIQKKKKKVPIFASNFENAKKIKKSKFEANFIGVLPPSLEELRSRINSSFSFPVEKVNKMLQAAEAEISQIQTSSFFSFRIVNDDFEGTKEEIKNAIKSIYPELKFSESEIEKIKNFDFGAEVRKKEGDENEKKNNFGDNFNINNNSGSENNINSNSNDNENKDNNKEVKEFSPEEKE